MYIINAFVNDLLCKMHKLKLSGKNVNRSEICQQYLINTQTVYFFKSIIYDYPTELFSTTTYISTAWP